MIIITVQNISKYHTIYAGSVPHKDNTVIIYLFKLAIKSVESMSSEVNIEKYMSCQIPINFF